MDASSAIATTGVLGWASTARNRPDTPVTPSAIGSYSHRTIAKLVFEWKYRVPPISL